MAAAEKSWEAEIPKSVRAGRWKPVKRMFAGLMSRWRMSCRCTVSTAPASCTVYSIAKVVARTRFATRIPRWAVEHSSITRKGRPSADRPELWMVTMFG